MLRFCLALLIGFAAQGQAGAAGPEDPWETEEPEAPAPAEAAGAAPSRTASKGKTSKSKVRSRRSRSRTGAKVVGTLVPDDKLRTSPVARPSGNIHIYNLSTHESLKVNIYNDDGSYNVESLQALSHILRCKRTDTAREMEPRLMTALSHVFDNFGEKRLEVVSGFRNQQRTTSYHYRGSATDIRVPGIKPTKLRAFVDSIDRGGMGIGLYPRTGFVHVDVRPPPSYRWIDWSRADPDSPDKRPPRSLRRKKLQS